MEIVGQRGKTGKKNMEGRVTYLKVRLDGGMGNRRRGKEEGRLGCWLRVVREGEVEGREKGREIREEIGWEVG